MPPTRGMLRGPRDPQSYRASLLRGGGREQQDQSFAFNPPSRNLRAAVAGEGKKLTAAGLGLVQRTPRPEGERWEMQRNTIPRGTALPCPAAPACGQGGSDPQPPTGSQRCFLPPTCWALRTANQGLIFALQRGLEAFRLQKRHARVFGPAAGPSVPATPARLMFHPPPAPCTSEQTAAGSQRQAYGHGGPKHRPDPSLPGVWVQMQPNGGWPCGSDRAFHREGLSSPMVERGLPAHLPVSTVVFYLQQGLFSKSSLKWLCLSSLLRYELKKKTNNKTKNQTPTTINTKTLTHQTLAACVTHKPHQYSVKKLILLKTIHSTRD